MGLLNRIQSQQDPFAALVQDYVSQNPNGPQMQPEPNRVSAPVVPDAGPSTAVPASTAPRLTKKKRGGLLGALESVFMPEPETLWASALRNGVWDAKAGQRQYSLDQQNAAIAQDTQRATNMKTRADAVTAERRGRYSIAGNNVVDYGDGTNAPTIIAAPTTPTENERLIDTWRTRQQANPNDPTLPLIERAIRGYQYTDPVISAQAAARTNTGLAVARERGAQSRMTKKTPGASGGGTRRVVSKPPAGFILNP